MRLAQALTPTLSEGHEGAPSWPSERESCSLSLWERARERARGAPPH